LLIQSRLAALDRKESRIYLISSKQQYHIMGGWSDMMPWEALCQEPYMQL